MFRACVDLDEMLHPFIFVLYLMEFVILVAHFSMAFSGTSTDPSASFNGGIFFFVSLVVLTSFAQMTVTSSLKLVPFVFDSYDLADGNVLREEVYPYTYHDRWRALSCNCCA